MPPIANPANTRFRYGPEATAGVGDPASWTDARITAEQLAAAFPTIDDPSIGEFGERAVGAESKIDTGNRSISCVLHLEDYARWLAVFFGKSATPVESPSGVWLHKLAVTETAVDFADRIALEIHRDRDRGDLLTGALPTSVGLSVAPRGFLTAELGLVYPRFHHFADAVQTVGSGSPVPYLRGLLQYANLNSDDAAANDVYMVVTQASPLQVKFKIGAASTYDGAAITVPQGLDADNEVQWINALHTASDVHVGDRGIPVQVMAPAGTYVLNDEFRWDHRRAAPTQSLAATSPLNEVYAELQIDGVKLRARQVQATMTRPGEIDEEIGGRFSDSVAEQGDRTYSFQMSRRAAKDQGLENRLIRAQSFNMNFIAEGPVIGATGVRRRLELIAKNCQMGGPTANVGGRASFDEQITWTAHPSTDGTYPAAVTAELTISASALT